jgi:hypothetical protein
MGFKKGSSPAMQSGDAGAEKIDAMFSLIGSADV